MFALMVLLVCVTVGSVVLASGSASAGRVSQIADVDTRYYSAMSAAEYFRDVIESQDEIEIVRTKTEVSTQVDTLTVKPEGITRTVGTPTVGPAIYASKIYQGDETASLEDSEIIKAAVDLVLGNLYNQNNADMWNKNVGISQAVNKEYLITVRMNNRNNPTVAATPIDDLKVKVMAQLNVRGELVFTFIAPADAAAGNSYKVTMVFDAIVTSKPDEAVSYPNATTRTEGNTTYNTITTTTITTRTVKVQWVFDHIE